MNLFITSAMIFFTSIVSSQNLVPNPSFENFIQCPNGVAEIYKLLDWKVYNSQTPDYFNSCTTNPQVSTPFNFAGHQEPLTGNSYTGAYFYTDSAPNEGREVIGVKLATPLVEGQQYHVCFSVSLARGNGGYLNAACNNIGVKFSTVQFNETDWIPIDNHAHVYTNNVIEDSTNWTQVYGSFVADSSYEYMAIGNFFDDANTELVKYDTTNFYTAYYYIENVFVSIDPSACGITLGLNDTKYIQRKLVKILDLTGRETEDKPNTVLIHVYSDGTTEKVFKIE